MRKLKLMVPLLLVMGIGIFSAQNSSGASPCNDCDGVVSTTFCGTILWYQYCGYNIPNNQRCALECKAGCDSCEGEVIDPV